jgi:PD-(D/E)XK nuclease superfamily protein
MAQYSDEELAAAIAGARSWRGVLRRLGLPPQSAGALRSARRRAELLNIDHGHFTGQRRWSDRDLAETVPLSRAWSDVLDRLGLASTSGSAVASIRAHSARLGLDVRHLDGPRPPEQSPFAAAPQLRHLDRAGPMLAAAWFTLRGYGVAWPLEPCRYDLLVTDDRRSYRIQVKTTRTRTRTDGSWAVRISSTRGKRVAVYTPDEVDHFFIIDGDLTYYLIPLEVVGGYQVIYLRRYLPYVVGRERLDAA